MPFVVVLWLALLHALSLAPSLRVPDDGAAGRHARVARIVGDERRFGAGSSERPDEALRIVRFVAETAPTRTTPPVPLGGGTPTPALTLPAPPALASSNARRALRQHGTSTHALAARGGLLAYFPTAPPRQG